jgi:hypothetical protein
MLTMFFIRFGEDCYVVQIDDHKFVSLSNEGDVHGSLEGFTCVHQSKWNFGIHECAPRSGECSLFSIFRKDGDLIVAKKSINHGNHRCTCHPLQHVFHLWQRVFVLRKLLFIFLKSKQSLISLLLFLTRTKLATHSKYLKGTMIWASNKFFTSLSIIGSSI